MRVALVGDEFPPDIGGAAIYTYELGKALAKKGIEIHFLTHWHRNQPLEEEIDGIRIKRVKGFVVPRFNRAISPYSFRRLHSVIKHGGYHVIHGADIYSPLACGGLWSARKRGIPSVFTCHTALTYNPLVAIAHFPILRILRRVPAVIAVSHAAKLFSQMLGIRAEKIRVIPNGVDLKTFNPRVDGAKLRRRIGAGTSPLIVTASRLTPYKQVGLLIRAFKFVQNKLPDSRLVIAGTGVEEKRLKRLARELELENSTVFLGKLSHKKIAELIAAADVCVIPSKVESMSLFALESLACGKPVIGPNRGGITSVVEQGVTGVLIPMRDPELLARTLVETVQDTELRRSARREGPRFVRKRFSWELCASRTLEVYRALR